MLWFSAPWVWDHDDDDEVRRKWETILEAYTSAKLTNAHKDKLIAIDGIMSYLAAVRKTWYTCGMFWKDLPQALCWQQVGVAPAQRATPYRAPSWSWASVDGEIMMPFVWEVAGTTRLTCALDTMTWVQNGTLKTALLCVGRTLALLPPHDRQDITNPRAYRVYTFYGQQVRLKFDNETEELTLTHRRFYYFPVVHVDLEVSGTQVRGSNAPRRMQAVDHNAILLVKNSDGTFSRVGQTSHNHNTVQCLLSPLLAAIQAQPAQLVVLV
ncbi:hypothetical protein B0A48_04802 [Cryoendolithus antarcticus]|uniref:Heterokaryon incompatibility domain-containing protein n=1 Tax=Cryoendolithus antarcticus TaxID=1507870 RepID=A0A1V8TDQ8_9PEZI|nr:hypothetical protein B0A48_04802 [Cryoendolithus antarcticus]